MRSLRTAMATALLLGIAPAVLSAQGTYGPKDLLRLKPILPGVEYETPNEQAIAACKIETVYNQKKHPIGYALRDGQGKMLRRFVDSNGKGGMDQWSYYEDGFEVYRESDLNDDKSPDECRWLNSGGTRIATVSGGKITGWKRLSAEEASKVFVQAIVQGNMELLETVMAKPGDLEGLGVPKAEIDRMNDATARRAEQIAALQRSVGTMGWNKTTVWSRLDGMMPHLIPADPATGLSEDVVLYENAVIFAGPPGGQPAPAKVAFLQAPEMIKVGETWKFIELPQAVDPEKPIVAREGGLRASLMREQVPGAGAVDPDLDAALKELAQYTKENANLLASAEKKDVARYHVGLIPKLNKVLKASKNAEEKLLYNKQIVDSLASAHQTGLFPGGRKLLDDLIAGGGAVGSYAAYRLSSAEFGLRNEENPGEFLANQKKWMADLKDFIARFPTAEEKPDAMFQLGQGYEFNAEEDEARKYYTELKGEFSNTEPGKKAAGALRRLDLVGKPIELKGKGLNNEAIDASQYKGKAVLITFWASWAESVKRDLPELVKVYQKNKSRGFEIIGINFDADRKDVESFVQEHKIPWPEIHEEGAMESRLAIEYGIISLPVMILVDAEGNVVNRNIRTAADVEKQLEKILPARQGGVALEGRR